MAEIRNRKITKSQTTQKLNLRKLLKKNPTEEERKRFTLAAIELINQRTLDGNDVDGESFTPYSLAYAEKKGVSPNSVDLFLNGDMLDSIKKVDETSHSVTIGIQGGEDALKSYAHNKGDGKMPKREFFGITEAEAQALADEIKQAERASSDRTTLADLEAALSVIEIEQVE